jgi:hypothetical protein
MTIGKDQLELTAHQDDGWGDICGSAGVSAEQFKNWSWTHFTHLDDLEATSGAGNIPSKMPNRSIFNTAAASTEPTTGT